MNVLLTRCDRCKRQTENGTAYEGWVRLSAARAVKSTEHGFVESQHQAFDFCPQCWAIVQEAMHV